MFDIPGFYPSELSDDQILKKLTELSSKLVYAGRFSGSNQMIGQLQTMIAALNAEQEQRYYRTLLAQENAMQTDVVVETEPDLRVEKDTKHKQTKRTDEPQKRKFRFGNQEN